jgi:hypothetical protein
VAGRDDDRHLVELDGIDDLKRIDAPNCWAMSPISGLRSRTLNGLRAGAGPPQVLDHRLLRGRHLVPGERLEPVAAEHDALRVGLGFRGGRLRPRNDDDAGGGQDGGADKQ